MAGITRRHLLALSAAAAAPTVHAADVNQEIGKMADDAPLRMQFRGSNPAECRLWQEQFAAKLRQLIGPHQPPQRWETVVEKKVELEDHRREELILRAKGHRDLPVYLLIPKPAVSSPRPGILALHGHGPLGYDAVAGIG